MIDIFDLSGRLALVTGGNGGLGLAIAIALHDAGADVIVTGRNPAKNVNVPNGLAVRTLDVTDPAQTAEVFNTLAESGSRIDVLVNNAGIYRDDPLFNDDSGTHNRGEAIQTWDDLIAVNLTGAYRCARLASRQMRERGAGKIINIGSAYSTFGHPRSAGYTATKTGLVGLTRALAVELGPYGIQSNAILPGWFPTEINGDLPHQQRGEEIRRRTPAGRWGETRDIAGLAVFLASGASDFVSGTAVALDGGYAISERFVY
jgi:2-deoxy-D-gluconate 3-dehydrogenase